MKWTSSPICDYAKRLRSPKNEESSFALGIAVLMIVGLLLFLASDAYVEMRNDQKVEISIELNNKAA